MYMVSFSEVAAQLLSLCSRFSHAGHEITQSFDAELQAKISVLNNRPGKIHWLLFPIGKTKTKKNLSSKKTNKIDLDDYSLKS